MSDTNFWVRWKTPQRVERRGMRRAFATNKRHKGERTNPHAGSL